MGQYTAWLMKAVGTVEQVGGAVRWWGMAGTGITACQEGVAGSEMTIELVGGNWQESGWYRDTDTKDQAFLQTPPGTNSPIPLHLVSFCRTHHTAIQGRNRWPFKMGFCPSVWQSRGPSNSYRRDAGEKKSFIFGGTFSDRTYCDLTYWKWESALVLCVGFPQVGYNTNRPHTRHRNLFSQSLLDILSAWPKWEMLQSVILWGRLGKIHKIQKTKQNYFLLLSFFSYTWVCNHA